MSVLSPAVRSTEAAQKAFREHLRTLSVLADLLAETGSEEFGRASGVLVDCLASGGKVMACGNGGSAADAQHFVAELVGRMLVDRPGLSALSLTTDTSVLTAVGNDYGYDQVFSRQVHALGRPGDVLVAISTSGRSPNIVEAVVTARETGLRVIALTGPGGHPVLRDSDVWIRVGPADAPHVQELHTVVLHALCIGVDQALFAHAANPFQIPD